MDLSVLRQSLLPPMSALLLHLLFGKAFLLRGTFLLLDVWFLDANRRTRRFIFCCFIFCCFAQMRPVAQK